MAAAGEAEERSRARPFLSIRASRPAAPQCHHNAPSATRTSAKDVPGHFGVVGRPSQAGFPGVQGAERVKNSARFFFCASPPKTRPQKYPVHSPSPCRPGWARPAGASLSWTGVWLRVFVVGVG